MSLLAACTDDPTQVPDAGSGVPVMVDTLEPPTLIVNRMEHSATWVTPRSLTPTTFELHVTGPYRMTVVCDEPDNGLVAVWQAALTPDDGVPWQFLSCDTQPPEHIVSGTMVQSGSVALDLATARSPTENWSFELAASSKTYALVARTDERIAIRRGLVVDGDTQLPTPVDMQTIGVPLEHVDLTVTNGESSERIEARTYLDVANTYTRLHDGSLEHVVVAPRILLDAPDRQLAIVSGASARRARSVQRAMRPGESSVFTLPPWLPPVLFRIDAEHQLSAIWSSLPDHDFVEISLDRYVSPVLQLHDLNVSRRFIEATGIESITIDTASLPRFRPEWRIDTSQEHVRYAAYRRQLATSETHGAAVWEVGDGGPLPSRGGEAQLGSTTSMPDAFSRSRSSRAIGDPRR